MRGQYTFVDKGLQRATTVSDGSLPVLARPTAAEIFELTRGVPSVLMLNTATASTGTQARLVKLCGCRLTTDRQDFHCHRLFRPVRTRARRCVVTIVATVLVILTVDLLLDLLQLLVHVGGDLFGGGLLLLNDDRLKTLARAAVAGYDVAGDEAVVVETEHRRLNHVLHLLARKHRTHRQGDGNADQFPKNTDCDEAKRASGGISGTHHWFVPLSELVTMRAVNVGF